MMFASTRVVFFIGFFVGYRAVHTHALPISFTIPTHISPREATQAKVESIELDGEERHIKFIMLADDDPEIARLYEITDVFKEKRALVKITHRLDEELGAGDRLGKEILYATEAEIYLHHQADDTYDYLVIRDVRKRQGTPDLKFFHEWYLDDFSMNAKNRLADLRDLIETELSKLADGLGLTNPNLNFWNVLVDRTFSTLVPIDWSPADDIYEGVKELPTGKHKTTALKQFYDDMEEFLPKRFNVKALEAVLNFFGKDLREADGGPIDEIRLNGINYELEPLPKADQGKFSTAYNILKGLLLGNGSRVPAILKVVIKDGSETKTEKEIGYLTKVGLLLASKSNSVAFYIAVRNVRKDDPPLKPYHEWYLEDSQRDLEADLKTLQTSVKKKMMEFAGEKLLYGDLHFQNIYIDKTLEIVMPIDWGPADGFWGVEEATGPDDITEYQKFLLQEVPKNLNRQELAYILGRYDKELRPGDRDDTAGGN